MTELSTINCRPYGANGISWLNRLPN